MVIKQSENKNKRLEVIEKMCRIQGMKREMERRKREEKIRFYNTGFMVHDKQMLFHKDLRRNRWVFGGNRTGKTECGAVEAVWFARGNHPFKDIPGPTRGWVVSLTAEVQRDVAQKKLLSYLNPSWIVDIHMRKGRKGDPENGIIDFIIIESESGGLSTIGFKSCDQGRLKFQGTSQHWIWFDEEPPVEIYKECKMRVIDTRGYMWGTMTPLQGLTWVYDVVYMNEFNDPEVWYCIMEWADNPFLSKDEIALLEATMSEDEKEARQHGRFVAITGLVYKEFREEIHVIDPFDVPHDWYDNISVDPGLSNPTSVHWYACDGDGTVYVIAEHYESDKDIEYHSKAILDMSRQLKWPMDGKGRVRALFDSAANQKTLAAERSVAELFYDQGILVNTNVDKSKWTGIQRVKQYLKLREVKDNQAVWPRGKPRLFIFRTCPNLIKEIKSYRWAESATGQEKDEPIKFNDHGMDDLRYYIMTKPEAYKPPKPEKTMIQLHKEKLARKAKHHKRWM